MDKRLVGVGAGAHDHLFSASNTLWHPGNMPMNVRSVESAARVKNRLSNEIQTPHECVHHEREPVLHVVMLVAVHDPRPRRGTPNPRATVRAPIELAGWAAEPS